MNSNGFKSVIQLGRWVVFRPMLWLSLLLHGAIAFIPSYSTQEQPDQETEVSIQIAPEVDVLPAPDAAADGAVELEEEPDTPPSPETEQNPITSEPPPTEVLNNALPPADPEARTNEPPLSNAPDLPPPPTNEPLPFSAFPHPSEGRSCANGLNNCREIQGGSFRQIGSSFVQELTNNGFGVEEEVGLSDHAKIYKVTQGTSTQYLSVLSGPQGGAIYILAAEPVTSTASLDAEIAALEETFETTLQEVDGAQPARKTDFLYPEFFFNDTAPRPEISNPLYVPQEASQVSVSLTSQLVSEGFKVDSLGRYAGAPIYQVSQGAFLGYLSVLPSHDAAGTLLVSWNQLPE
ncbi:MAG: hypothetical protein VKL39_04485 [Leptolyngbyaceae bacterium]|nr:hypothetical protein [Leptolyngbyaceae bacterium]